MPRPPERKIEMPVTVECPNCGYEWEPSPKRWRNFYNIINSKPKILVCPDCQERVRLSVKDVREIVRRNVPRRTRG